jgi:chitinase
MAADSAARAAFVANLTTFCTTNGYDGADIDWEYPKTAADRDNHRSLIHALRAAFDGVQPRLLLSMAGPATGWGGQWFDYESTKADFDWIGIMTYDYYGAWTPKAGPNSALYGETPNTEGWMDYSVAYYSGTRGIAKDKLLVGVPFYGQQFNASSLYGTSTGAVQILYKNIEPKMTQGWVRSWNGQGMYPYMINPAGTQVITYDDSQSVSAKCSYVQSQGLGGIIIWALGQDEMGGQQPLLASVASRLSGPVGVPRVRTMVVPESLVLAQNYPNPFNGQTIIRFQLRKPMTISLKVYDVLGREVVRLVDGHHAAGEYEVSVSSSALSAGSYLYRLDSPEGVLTRILVVLP